MTADETVAAAIEWARDLIPELRRPRSDTEAKFPLPDITADITDVRQRRGRLEQQVERLREVRVVLAVDPEPADSAGRLLYEFTDRLMDDLARDPRMGARVRSTLPDVTASLDADLVTREDTLIARGAIVMFTVVDLAPTA